MYTTRDLKFSAVLYTLGFKYYYTVINSRVVFHFDDLEEEQVTDIRVKYNNKSDELLVKPLSFIEAWHSMLDIVHEVKRVEAEKVLPPVKKAVITRIKKDKLMG